MRIFQTVFFIIEIIVYLGIGAIMAMLPQIIFEGKYAKKKESTQFNYCYLYDNSIIKRPEKKKIGPWNVVWFVIVFSITLYFIKPYIFDIPQLITGKLTYVTDYVRDTRTYKKDMHQYVHLSRGKEVKFLFITDIKRGEEYKIGYLNNSKRAIYCEEIGSTSYENKIMGFPFKGIAFFIGGIAIVILLMIISLYLKLKVFIPITIISSFIYIFYFVKYGLSNGIWISYKNQGFLFMVIELILALIVLSMLWLEKRTDPRNEPVAYFFAQLFSIASIGMCIGLIFNIPM